MYSHDLDLVKYRLASDNVRLMLGSCGLRTQLLLRRVTPVRFTVARVP